MNKIEFERTGGFMGRTIRLTLNLDELPPEDARTLRGLLDDSDFFNLQVDSVKDPAPDSFDYAITATLEKKTRAIHTDDASAPEKLRPLIDELAARAKRGG